MLTCIKFDYSPSKYPHKVSVDNQQLIDTKTEKACYLGIELSVPEEDTYDSGGHLDEFCV